MMEETVKRFWKSPLPLTFHPGTFSAPEELAVAAPKKEGSSRLRPAAEEMLLLD
jgi:hypothetical protein